jgi:peptidoglycan/xylan/chitin deacetylase (PgdA/CDA1 family)
MMSKRERLARLLARLGVVRALEALPQKRALLAFNYHRIGDWRNTPYDPALFSATAEEFDRQIAYLKRRFAIVPLPEAIEFATGRKRPPQTAVAITFDDGYLDNYQTAFPILRSHGVSATFFVPTDFVGTRKLPWWDKIAYQIRSCGKSAIRLKRYQAEFAIAGPAMRDGLRLTLNVYKQRGGDVDEFLDDVAEATGVATLQEAAEPCFLGWEQAREMQNGGMFFGSHTHTHRILSKLTAEEQLVELRQSRAILEERIGGAGDVLAYPVGGRATFNGDTRQALRAAGYRAAFSFYGGLNGAGHNDPYDIRRFGVDSQSMPRLRLQTAAVAALGRGWL